MDLTKYRQLYVTETQEILANLSRTLVGLESHPDDREQVTTAFRLFHSIKGMSGTMGFTPVFDLAHQLEELMDRVRSGRLVLEGSMVDLLLAGVDRLSGWVAEVDAEQVPVADEASATLHGRIRRVLTQAAVPPEGLPRAEAPTPMLKRAAGDLVIEVKLASSLGSPGLRGYLLLRRLGALGVVLDSVPTVEVLRAGRLEGVLRLALRAAQPGAVVAEFIRLFPEWTLLYVGDGDASSSLEHELLFTGEFDTSLPGDTEVRPPNRPSGTPLLWPETVPPGALPADSRSADPAAIVRAPRSNRTVRVRADWLDDLVGRLETLSTLGLALEREVPASTAHTLTEVRRLIKELEREARATRREPLSTITDPLLLVVRNLARQVGKRAVLRVEGAEQPLDRAVIEGVDVALAHLVRNAVEHGLETPEVRRAAGKAGTGMVALRCRRIRDEVVIELADDGAGIDPDRLVERAVALRLLSVEEARRLARTDLVRLMGLPGLTTREEVGALAGRGVGMDAISQTVTALGGTLQVQTRVGRGTLFRLRLPASRSLVSLREVTVGGQRFMVLESRIEEALPVPRLSGPGRDLPEALEAWIDHQGMRWPVCSLAHALALPPTARAGGALLLREPRRAFLVDALGPVRRGTLQPMPPPLDRLKGFLGAVVPPEGPPLLVLDLAGFSGG